MYLLYIEHQGGKLFLSTEEVQDFTISFAQRFDGERFKTIESARSKAFELLTGERYRISLWDLKEDCWIQNVS